MAAKKVDAKSILEIDRYDLQGELVRQPMLYYEWATALAEAKAEVDRLKGHLDLVEAELSSEIRNDPSDYGLEKATVDAIKGCVLMQKGYQAAFDELNEAKEEVGKLDAMLWAINHKKTSLELYVQMEVSGLHAEPKLPKGEAAKVKEERRNEVARKTQR